MDGTSPPSEAGQEAVERMERRLGVLEGELGRLQELVVRAYEQTPQAAAELLKARRGDFYADAYAPEPLVTVRIGTYDGDEMLFERALSSVRRQSYSKWEAIVVCDGRQESTARRIATLGDARIRCVQRPRNGPYPSDDHPRWLVAGAHPFNDAFALARGAWIAPIDQDDEWAEDHLEVLLDAAQRTRAEVAYGVARVLVGSEGETYFGAWPARSGDFGFQAAIHHAALAAFLYDANSHLTGEPADWNLARRMLEAGVRFEFVERIVSTYYIEERSPGIGWWRERLRERGPFSPSPQVDI